jgi:WXG100 family type VII secretion target
VTTKVTHDRLNSAANHAINAGESIKGDLNKTLDEIQSLSTRFQGIAGTATQNASGELGQELSNIIGALNRLAEGVHASNKSLGAADDDSGSDIGNVSMSTSSTPVTSALRGQG